MRFNLSALWGRFWPARDHDVLSFGLACLAWGWAVVFLWPGDTFARSPVWLPFQELCPVDAAWGVGLLLLGTAQHAARMAHRVAPRRWAAAAGFLWWFGVWWAFTWPTLTSGATPGTGSAVYGVLWAGYAWLFHRLRAPDAA